MYALPSLRICHGADAYTVEFDPGCEAMVFTKDGTPLQGITGGYGGDRRVEHIIPRSAVKAGKYELVIESSCNGMFGVPWNGDTIAPPDVRITVYALMSRRTHPCHR